MNRIAIDMDEVLVPFVKPLAKWKNLKMPPNNTRYNYVFREMFDITEEESSKMVHEFYDSKEFKELKPIMNSQLGVIRLRGKAKKIYVVTGRQNKARQETERWLERYFPGMFDDLIITNSYTEHEVKKVDICKSLALNAIIDDNMSICKECEENGITAHNFMGHDEIYPWVEHSNMSMYGWK